MERPSKVHLKPSSNALRHHYCLVKVFPAGECIRNVLPRLLKQSLLNIRFAWTDFRIFYAPKSYHCHALSRNHSLLAHVVNTCTICLWLMKTPTQYLPTMLIMMLLLTLVALKTSQTLASCVSTYVHGDIKLWFLQYFVLHVVKLTPRVDFAKSLCKIFSGPFWLWQFL